MGSRGGALLLDGSLAPRLRVLVHASHELCVEAGRLLVRARLAFLLLLLLLAVGNIWLRDASQVQLWHYSRASVVDPHRLLAWLLHLEALGRAQLTRLVRRGCK